jgi:hypothetical protein
MSGILVRLADRSPQEMNGKATGSETGDAEGDSASECSYTEEGSGGAGSFASDTSLPDHLDDLLVNCAAGDDVRAKQKLYLSKVSGTPPVSVQLQSLLDMHSPAAWSSASPTSQQSGDGDAPLQTSMPFISSRELSADGDTSLSLGSDETESNCEQGSVSAPPSPHATCHRPADHSIDRNGATRKGEAMAKKARTSTAQCSRDSITSPANLSHAEERAAQPDDPVMPRPVEDDSHANNWSGVGFESCRARAGSGAQAMALDQALDPKKNVLDASPTMTPASVSVSLPLNARSCAILFSTC